MSMDAARQDVHSALVGQILDGDLRIDEHVAEGGFAYVYRATQIRLGRRVALKVLKTPPHLNEAGIQVFHAAFTREAQTMARLNHPNIAQVLDFGFSPMPDGTEAPWIALEWLNGSTIHDILQARRGTGGMSPSEALQLLRPVFKALAHAHAEGVAHRDIKPANILLVDSPHGSTAKLLDFGVAKHMMEGDEDPGTGQTRTHAGMRAFSLNYAAPEQVGGSRTGPWTDVHALALVLTEVLTDAPPYFGPDRTAKCAQILAHERPTPAYHGVDVGAWEPIIAKAMSLLPGERYTTVSAFLEALEEKLPKAHPARTWKRNKEVRSRRVIAGVLIALGVAVGAVAGAADQDQPAPKQGTAHPAPAITREAPPQKIVLPEAVSAPPVQLAQPPEAPVVTDPALPTKVAVPGERPHNDSEEAEARAVSRRASRKVARPAAQETGSRIDGNNRVEIE